MTCTDSRTDSIIHVFLAEGVGGASVASDRGSAPKKGRECLLQSMDEERAKPMRSSQWEARRPETTTEPLQGAGHRRATHPLGGRVTSGRIPPTLQEGLKNCWCDPSKSSRLGCWPSTALVLAGVCRFVLVPWRLVRGCPCGFESHRGGWSIRSSQALPQESRAPQGQFGKPCGHGQVPAEL